MYNLNYTYITDLDIDTSNSYRDISALAMFMEVEKNDYYVPLSAVTNRFVVWFFDPENDKTSELSVTFSHAYLTGNVVEPKAPDSLIPVSLLKNTISAYLENIKERLLDLVKQTTDTLSINKIMPVGTVVINKANNTPLNGTWMNTDKQFLIEAFGNIKLGSTLELNNRALSSINLNIDKMPKHFHEVTFSPSTKNVSAILSGSSDENGSYTFGNILFKWNNVPDANTKALFAKSGYDAETKKEALIASGEKMAGAYNNCFSIAAAGTASSINKSINVVPPRTELEDAKIFLKTNMS